VVEILSKIFKWELVFDCGVATSSVARHQQSATA